MTRRLKTHWPPGIRIRHDVVTAFLIAAVAAGAQALTWTTHGPTRGNVSDLAAAASAPRTLYATTSAGVFRSDDAGDTWRDVSRGIRGATHVVVDPRTAETAYVTTPTTVFKTTNGGSAWRDVGGTLHAEMSTSSLLIDPSNPSTLYLGSRCGPIGFKGGASPLVSSIDPFGGAGVYKSTDAGETWTLKINGLLDRSFGVCVEALTLDPAQPQHLFGSPLYNDGGYSESFDGGETWTRAPSLVPADALVAHPQFPTVRYGVNATNQVFLSSTDGGATWSNSRPPVAQQRELRTIAIDASTARLFLGTDAGVFRSGDGGANWVDTGLVTAPVSRIVVDNAAGFVYAATAAGAYRMPLPLGAWSAIDMHDVSSNAIHVAADPNDPSTAFTGTADYYVNLPIGAGGRLFVTHDNGGSWQLVRAGKDISNATLSVDGGHNVYVGVVADPKRAGWLYRIRGTVLQPAVEYSRDGGATWTASPTPMTPAAITLDPSKPSTIYVTGDPNLGAKISIIRSDDAGLTWNVVLPGSSLTKFLTVAPSRSSTLYRFVGTTSGCDNGGYAFSRSADGGATWSDFAWPDACGYYPQAMAVDPRDARSVWVVSFRNRILHTPDGGVTWEIPVQPPGVVNDIAFSADGATLHATVSGGGVWEASVAGPHHRPARR